MMVNYFYLCCMDGKDLYIKHTSKRDYSGSSDDEYAQLLFTIFLHLKEAIYPLLEKAQALDKKLKIKESLNDDFLINEYSEKDIIIF